MNASSVHKQNCRGWFFVPQVLTPKDPGGISPASAAGERQTHLHTGCGIGGARETAQRSPVAAVSQNLGERLPWKALTQEREVVGVRASQRETQAHYWRKMRKIQLGVRQRQ